MTHSSAWRKAARVERSALAALSLAPSLRKPCRFVGNQVLSSEELVHAVRLSDERQRLFGMCDVGIDGASVDAEVTCSLTHRVCFFGSNAPKTSEKSVCFHLKNVFVV